MNVWIMNLKDNRDTANEDSTAKKFEFCKKNGIVGIGWVDYEENQTENLGYTKAKASLKQFEPHDLVWVKDTIKKEYYICEITEETEGKNKKDYKNYDISEYRCCKYHYVGSSEWLSESIREKDLVAISTIQKANDSVAKVTIDFFNTLFVPKPERTDVDNYQDKTRKVSLIIVLISICALVGLETIPNMVSSKSTSSSPSNNSSTVSQKSSSTNNKTANSSNYSKPYSSNSVNSKKMSFQDFYSKCNRLYNKLGVSDNTIQNIGRNEDTYHFEIKNLALVYVKTNDGYVESVVAVPKEIGFYTETISSENGLFLYKLMAVPSFALTGDDMETMILTLLENGKRNASGVLEYETASYLYNFSISNGGVPTLFSVSPK